MKTVLILAGLLLAALLPAPADVTFPNPVQFGTTLPATCSPGSPNPIFFLTNGGKTTGSLYECSAPNTWTMPGGGGGTIPSTTNTLVGDGAGNAAAAAGAATNCMLVNGTSTACSAGGEAAAYTSVSFSSTPTFTAGSNTADAWTITLTGNVSGSTLASAATGERMGFKICQDGTGGRTFAWPAGFTNAAMISPIASVCTKQEFYWDGSSAVPLGPAAMDGGPAVFSAETSAPGTPPSGDVYCWFDSTDHSGWECKANNSANVFKLTLSGVDINPVTGQLTLSGTTCTNQVVTVLSARASGTCTTITSAYIDGSIAPTANPVLKVDSSLGTSTGSGLILPGTSLTAGDLYYWGSSGLALAKADSASTLPGVCVAITTTACAFSGVYRFSGSQSWTSGNTIYVSDATGGALVTTAPTTSGHFLQIVGIALANDTMLILPSPNVGGIQ